MNILPLSQDFWYKSDSIDMIGNVIPKQKYILVTGLPDSHETGAVLSFLAEHDEKPFVFNFNPNVNTAKYPLIGMTDDSKLFDKFMGLEVEDLDGQVIVTNGFNYIHKVMEIKADHHEFRKAFANRLEWLIKEKGYTIIVTGLSLVDLSDEDSFRTKDEMYDTAFTQVFVNSVRTLQSIVCKWTVKYSNSDKVKIIPTTLKW